MFTAGGAADGKLSSPSGFLQEFAGNVTFLPNKKADANKSFQFNKVLCEYYLNSNS